jgi:hypothetical protein
MLKQKQQKTATALKNGGRGWDAVIYDAEQMMARFSQLVDKLKKSINSFQQMRDQGVPFPEPKRGRPKTKNLGQ